MNFALVLLLAAGCQTAQVKPDQAKSYAALLKKHVKKGLVDYKAIEKQDLKQLDAYLDSVAKAKLPADKAARIAFYIDAYNALVIRSVIKNGRPRSVLDVKGFFDKQTHTVAGKTVTLDSLEKKELNPYAKDPRTHFVLVCGAVGCPILESTPFAGSDVNKRMDAATRRYLASPYGAKVADGALSLSMIFKWYEKDFGGSAFVIDFVKKHLPAAQAKQAGAQPKVDYIDYNWTLNQQ